MSSVNQYYSGVYGSSQIMKLTDELAKTYDQVRVYRTHEEMGPGTNVRVGSSIDYAKQAFNVVRKMETEKDYEKFKGLIGCANGETGVWATYVEKMKRLGEMRYLEIK